MYLCRSIFGFLASPKVLRLGIIKLSLASALDFSYICCNLKYLI